MPSVLEWNNNTEKPTNSSTFTQVWRAALLMEGNWISLVFRRLLEKTMQALCLAHQSFIQWILSVWMDMSAWWGFNEGSWEGSFKLSVSLERKRESLLQQNGKLCRMEGEHFERVFQEGWVTGQFKEGAQWVSLPQDIGRWYLTAECYMLFKIWTWLLDFPVMVAARQECCLLVSTQLCWRSAWKKNSFPRSVPHFRHLPFTIMSFKLYGPSV